VIRLPEIQELVRIPIPGTKGVPIFWYGVMLLLGFTMAMLLARRLARQEGVPPTTIYDLALWALVSGLVGARLWYVAEFSNRVWFENGEFVGLGRAIGRTLNVSDGGLVFYGGLVLPVIVLAWWFRRRKLPILKMLDILAPPAMLGLAFGRIGCLFNGCCFGKLCSADFPMALRRPAGGATWRFHEHYYDLPSTEAWSMPVLPAQAYASICAFLLCGLLVLLYRRKKRDGDILVGLLLSYPVVRFLLEAIREHEPSETFGFISVSQTVSLVGFLIGVLLVVKRKARPEVVPYVPPESAVEEAPKPKKPKRTPASAAAPPPKRRKRPRT